MRIFDDAMIYLLKYLIIFEGEKDHLYHAERSEASIVRHVN
ncbi:MAG: hypothetical protein JWR38_1535 [Mucilaginibacter sp.]|nr:hypothetical protein [Mucilaginibacter sp.]